MQETKDAGECPDCGRLVQFEQTYAESAGKGEAYVYICPNPQCKAPNVVLDLGGEWSRFPARQPKDIEGVPLNVMQAYREATISLEAGAPRAAACMLRRTVASACSDQGVPDEEGDRWLGLDTRIDRLKDKLLPATYAVAKATKLLGDAGAHEEAEERLGPINQETVRVAAEVVRQFLANLYELPEQIKQLGNV